MEKLIADDTNTAHRSLLLRSFGVECQDMLLHHSFYPGEQVCVSIPHKVHLVTILISKLKY